MFSYHPRKDKRGYLVKDADLHWYTSRTPTNRAADFLGTSPGNVRKIRRHWEVHRPGGSMARILINGQNATCSLGMIKDADYEILAAVAFLGHNNRVVDALATASGRGVKVHLITRPGQLTGPIQQKLHDAGIFVDTVQYLHSKVVLADTTAMVGSANWTQYSSGRNWEMGIFTPDQDLVQKIRLQTQMMIMAADR